MRITFIVVTAILSVLLLACIAGALAYYFLRVRQVYLLYMLVYVSNTFIYRSGSYENLEEDGSGKVRFGKNSLSRSPSSKWVTEVIYLQT